MIRFSAALISFVVLAGVPVVRAAVVATEAPTLRATYLYRLSNWSGPVPSSGAGLAYDRQTREVYVVGGGDGSVGLFSDNGMEVYSFGHDSELHSVVSLAPLASGALIAISRDGDESQVVETDYRGEVTGTWRLDDLPARLRGEFDPVRVVSAGDAVYLADLAAWQVVKTDNHGRFLGQYDLGLLLTFDNAKKRRHILSGVGVDEAGNLLLTVATDFAAYVITPDHEVRRFGTKGELPGEFAVINSIAADEAGNLYITDLNRSVVMVFDPSFRFLGEFGYRGRQADALVIPRNVVAGNGKVFVSQGAGRGVSVFKVNLPETRKLDRNPSTGEQPAELSNRGETSTKQGRS
jgi:DNA-binding beta-propeller fold protein YncE